MPKIEINGKVIEVPDQGTIIEAADQAGIPIPRFCYHKKLEVAANCRMCLVEVEKSPKPVPACATPVTDGMKVWTHSEKAKAAQKGVMEFLLINHPLDCPICDQGGECELQDLSLEYGSARGRYTEGKRAVKDQNLGPLIATDMTRCIHCTRCVRFGVEVAGLPELGATGRNEHMRIGTYLEQNLRSEVSGNVIDLCPVGALTSKPFRFTARGWELRQSFGVSPHDALGSNLSIHTRNGRVMRIVPRESETINETWISDRDRFSYEALHSPDRLLKPMIKKGGRFEPLSWEAALDTVIHEIRRLEGNKLGHLGCFLSPNTPLEEAFLLNDWMRMLKADFLEYRLRQSHEGGSWFDHCPSLGMPIIALENQEAILLIGCRIHAEHPVLALRLRKTALAGAEVVAVNPCPVEYHFPVQAQVEGPNFGSSLAGLVKALMEIFPDRAPLGAETYLSWLAIKPTEAEQALAQSWKEKKQTLIVLGALAVVHPAFSQIWSLATLMSHLTLSTIALLPSGANETGIWLCTQVDFSKRPMPSKVAKAYLLWGIDPALDGLSPDTQAMIDKADFVVAATPFRSDSLDEVADLYLPITTVFETSGTFVNMEGRWQTFKAAARCPDEVKPGWWLLTVLGKAFGLKHFEFETIEQVLESVHARVGDPVIFQKPIWVCPSKSQDSEPAEGFILIMPVPIYRTDMLVRRAPALQATEASRAPKLGIPACLAEKWSLKPGDRLKIKAQEREATFPIYIHEGLSEVTLYLHAGFHSTSQFKPFERVIVKKENGLDNGVHYIT